MAEKDSTREDQKETCVTSGDREEPMILEEIDLEEIFIDGICGVY